MNINKIKYNKLNKTLYKKLQNINYVKNIKCIKLHTNKNYLISSSPVTYIKILNTPSTYLKVNYKELNKVKKKLKSGYMILSTPLGVLTDKKSILYKTGGLILCYIKTK